MSDRTNARSVSLQRLLAESESLIAGVSMQFKRFLYFRLDLKAPVTGVIGQRGAGKSFLLRQLAREKLKQQGCLYLNLVDPVFSRLRLTDAVTGFVQYGGTVLLLDDLHLYADGLTEVKALRTHFPDLRIVFTCSSSGNEEGLIYELSRFSELHELPLLSFREFLEYRHGLSFPVIRFDELLDYNLLPGAEVYHRVRVLSYFDDFLKCGMYFTQQGDDPPSGLQIRSIYSEALQTDVMAVWRTDYESLRKIHYLVSYIADNGPLKPNIERLAGQSGTSRDSLLKFLKYLHKARIIGWLTGGQADINYLNKPDRLYLHDPNLILALAAGNIDRSVLLETFVLQQVRRAHQVNLIAPGSFLIDLEHRFDLDWMVSEQPVNDSQYYRVSDHLEKKAGDRIPVWMLGFLY